MRRSGRTGACTTGVRRGRKLGLIVGAPILTTYPKIRTQKDNCTGLETVLIIRYFT